MQIVGIVLQKRRSISHKYFDRRILVRNCTDHTIIAYRVKEFVALLNELRYGTLNFLSMTSLASLSGKSKMEESSGMQPTCLFPTRQEVEKAKIGRAHV